MDVRYCGIAVDGPFKGHRFMSLSPWYSLWVDESKPLEDFKLVKESDISGLRVVTYAYESRCYDTLDEWGIRTRVEVDGVWKLKESTRDPSKI